MELVEDKTKVIVRIGNVLHNGNLYKTGEELSLTEQEIERLGAIVEKSVLISRTYNKADNVVKIKNKKYKKE